MPYAAANGGVDVADGNNDNKFITCPSPAAPRMGFVNLKSVLKTH